jgi:pyruvate dehydrogenase E2 component (dihydrolipoamide acetyltransferase)
MPMLSPSMKSGVVSRWRAKIGDKLAAYDLIVDVKTMDLRKEGQDVESDMEVEVVEGDLFFAKALVEEGSSVNVGEPIALLCERSQDLQYASALTSKDVASKGYPSALWQAYVKSPDDPGALKGCD